MTEHHDTAESTPSEQTVQAVEQTAGSEPPEKKKGKKSRKFKVFAGLAATLFVFFVAVAAALVWLATTESGLRFGLYKIPSWFGVSIQSKTLQGTLWDGFKGDDWRIETEGADVDISRFDFDWQPNELMQKKLHIEHILAGDIQVVTKPTPPREEQPASGFPQSVSLPLEVMVDRLETGKISVGSSVDKQTVYLEKIGASYVYNHQLHNLKLTALQTPWTTLSGSATLGTKSPFSLNAIINGDGMLDNEPIVAANRFWGSLQDVQTDIRIDGDNVRLHVDSVLHPFAEKLNDKVELVQVVGFNINPKAFLPSLPKALLQFEAAVKPSFEEGLALQGSIDLLNPGAAAADAGGIPVRELKSAFFVDQNGLVNIDNAAAQLLQKGVVALAGDIDTAGQKLALGLALKNITAADVVEQSLEGSLNGTITVGGNFQNLETGWMLNTGNAVSDGLVQMQTDKQNGQQTLLFKNARIRPENGGVIQAEGSLELFKDQILQLVVTSNDFNPNRLNPQFPAGSVNGTINFAGELANQKYSGKMAFGPSTLSGVPLRGSADVVYEKAHLSRALTDILLGNNSIKTNGSFGKQGDRLNVDINAPDLARFGFGLNGLVTARGFIAGDMKTPEANLNGQARNLRVGNSIRVNDLDFNLQGSPDYTRPLNIELRGNNIAIAGEGAPTVIDTVDLAVNGTGRNHRIRGRGNMSLAGKPYQLNINAEGGLDEKQQWKGTLSTLDISGAFNLTLQNRMRLEAGSERVVMSAARWAAMGGSLNMENFVWDSRSGITTKGSASNLAMAQLHNFYEPPVQHNLVLSADWDLSYSNNARGYLNIRRQSGDIELPYRKQMLGLGALSLNTRFQNGRIDTTLNGVTGYGNIDGNLVINQQFGNDISLAPMSGQVRISAPDLERFRYFMPIGQSLRGNLLGVATIGGRVGDPQLNGTLNGDNLYYRNQDLGLILDNGVLRSRLQGQTWVIDQLRFHRGGSVELKGTVNMSNAAPDVDVDIVLDKYHALDKVNRRLTISGNAKMLYSQAQGITLTGALKADSGRFGLQKSSMPTLDEDVVVLGEVEKPVSTPLAINMNLTVDLNNSVRFSGVGLDVTLGGKLQLVSKPGESIQGIGTVTVVKGGYKAYGQDLDITKGSISFVGPLDQPNLNIRAERRQSPVGAGVEVLGNLGNPRVSLVANEAMSEKDKLSWLILNRASSGSDGDNAALSAAAGAFLAGSVNDRLGLVDEIGFTSKRSRNAQTGEMNPAEQVLTVGKQLTNDLYFGYEYGLNTSTQAVKLIYQLTRALQAVARVSSVSWGGEVKYSIRFD
ncbi:translocation/assembly module TamB domain-containing protein [Neisseria zalophi]|uniref:Translocation/assembly module TamB n=1 Tax=Neisseria zalophi TaxID=640030 RepID=A0A5J6PVI8_9NEIS|nr:translocation/assembly module TamB domain-containing protein [Neisseria zalophi]QEY26739.1 translocation/assembly module TamB [Neisseria zalophi]